MKLLKKCRILEIERYIESRRGTLRGFLETTHPPIFNLVHNIHPPARASNKILWWNQKSITKREPKVITKEWLDKRKIVSERGNTVSVSGVSEPENCQ